MAQYHETIRFGNGTQTAKVSFGKGQGGGTGKKGHRIIAILRCRRTKVGNGRAPIWVGRNGWAAGHEPMHHRGRHQRHDCLDQLALVDFR